MVKKIVLASSSRFRQELLRRIEASFTIRPSSADESIEDNETIKDTVTRLSNNKVLAVKANENEIIVGSDQLGDFKGRHIGKPLSTKENANQLRSFSGQLIIFHTGLFVLHVCDQECRDVVVSSTLIFRNLTDTEIEEYVETESALQCAGGFKFEGLGISLIEKFHSSGPTAIIGLPLISLSKFLCELGK